MLSIMQKAALSAGDILLKYFKKGVSATQKTSHKDLVTQADIESQKIIYKIIGAAAVKSGLKKGEIGFIGEEKLNITGKHTFIIDPLDGTGNFTSGFDYFSISIAYSINQRIVESLVYHPAKKVFYSAEYAKGAYKTEGNIRKKLNFVLKPYQDSVLAVYLPQNEKIREKEFKFIQKIFPLVRQLKSTGSNVLDLCNTADNLFSINIMGSSCIWDLAAAGLILRESGGNIYDWNGKEIQYDFTDSAKLYKLIACHPKLLHELLRFFD